MKTDAVRQLDVVARSVIIHNKTVKLADTYRIVRAAIDGIGAFTANLANSS